MLIERVFTAVAVSFLVSMSGTLPVGAEEPSLTVDRITLLLPVEPGTASVELEPGRYPDESLGDFEYPGWNGYLRVWKAHHQNPDDVEIRRFLGLSLNQASAWTAKRSRSAPTWLEWKPGTYAEVDTPHFVIFSQARETDTAAVAVDLERCYWAWTQMFFPHWEASSQVASVLKDLSTDESVISYLQNNRGRITIRRKLRIVLFRDATEYARTLGKEVPGVERSTGFYSDVRKTMCLYASETGDAATRRHELVHQLFREATRSGLGRSMPGENAGFWLVEGIAGYFESLFVDGDTATVGGWDSPRLQFSRYRMLANGDYMPMEELQLDGRLAAQKREDIARWYAHAITQTHRLIDGGDADDRWWILGQLADLYKIRLELPSGISMSPVSEQAMQDFLSINDKHLLANKSARPLESLCLAGCEVSEAGLNSLGEQSELTWLDLARLPVGNRAIQSLVPKPAKLEQLALEATRVDSNLSDWLSQASALQELDLSWTTVDDRAIRAIGTATNMSVLWMTGTRITDASIDTIASLKELTSVDVQRSAVSLDGLEKLRKACSAEINPLELRTSP